MKTKNEASDSLIASMHKLCKENFDLGPYNKMSSESTQRSIAIRGEIWDNLESLCVLRGMEPTPESLSSSAGCLPTIFEDYTQSIEDFKAIVKSELAMM